MATMMKRVRRGESERNRIAMAFRWLLNRSGNKWVFGHNAIIMKPRQSG